MGIDAGFDMVPRLSRGAVDRENWRSFIEGVKTRFKDDELVEINPNYIVFKAGEHPMLPFEGHKFLRFSSKISGSHAEGVEEYIDSVKLSAQMWFGSRVRPWNEIFDQHGFYGWKEVNQSFKSYEQPDEEEISTTIAQFVIGTDPTSELNLPLFKIQAVQDKGQGLVALFNIAKGKRIILEKPLFTTRNLAPISLMESKIAEKLKALSKAEQRQFLTLHNNFPGKYPFSGITKTNALPCGSGAVIGGVYPTICRINHSCLPNAHNNWNSDTETETIHATRFIKAGEEITISYVDGGDPFESRQEGLKASFGFECACSLCVLPQDDIQKSDDRRQKIQTLDDAIGDPKRLRATPEKSLADCYSLLQLLEEEYRGSAVSLLARLYYDAFQICITHGDQARASSFAEKGYRARVVCEGDDSPQSKHIKSFMENPSRHMAFGTSNRWRTAKSSVPKGLDTDAFEKWLWRRGK